MQASMTPLAPVEPQFATVTFVGEDSVPGSTFRVPLNSTTTVSRLAKDAMKRLVLSRPSDDRHRQFPSIVVTEVYVGGTGAQPKAEVFAQDIVSQVVLVREEVVFMRLRATASSAASSRLPTPPPPDTAAVPPTEAAESAPPAPASAPAPPPVRAEVAADKGNSKPVAAAAGSHKAPHRAADEAQSGAATRRTTVASTTAVAAKEPAEERVRRPGWGPEAHEHFADNYVSTPGKRRRAPAARKSAATTAAAAAPASQRAKTEEAPAPQQGSERGLRWGPQASMSFPANYVSSPDKLARLARQRQRMAEKAASNSAKVAAAPPIAPKAAVSRALVYPTDSAEDGRTTVGHTVDREVVMVDEEPPTAAELPKGWGAESLRFFDPNTYCDDPKKARLSPNMDLSRSSRRRRPASPQ